MHSLAAAVERWRGREVQHSAFPEEWIPTNLDDASPRRKSARIVENVDEHLLYLAGFETQPVARRQIRRNGNRLFICERPDFVPRLLQTLPHVAWLPVGAPVAVSSDAQLEHCRSHARKTL